MIRVSVGISGDRIAGFSIKGHALSGQYGQDLVCAGASSVVFGAMNALDEMYPGKCDLKAGKNSVDIRTESADEGVQTCLKMLQFQLQTLADDYPKNIQVKKKEV